MHRHFFLDILLPYHHCNRCTINNTIHSFITTFTITFFLTMYNILAHLAKVTFHLNKVKRVYINSSGVMGLAEMINYLLNKKSYQFI